MGSLSNENVGTENEDSINGVIKETGGCEVEEEILELYKRNGYPTLRSSTHLVKNARKLGCKRDKKQNQRKLPDQMMKETIVKIEPVDSYNQLKTALTDLLAGCGDIIGKFAKNGSYQRRLEYFRVPMTSLTPSDAKAKKRTLKAQKTLSELVVSDEPFMEAFDNFVSDVALPHMKQQLEGSREHIDPCTFYYQRPPTIRIQPGPSTRHVRTHKDSDYGHQDGELNFWIPFTDLLLTDTTLWTETISGAGDFHRMNANEGEMIVFHGTSCRHYVNPNSTEYTRVSIDFRIGVEGYFDSAWQMVGTSDDHSRRKIQL